MLMPKRVKHRKVQRGRRSGMAKGGTTVLNAPDAYTGGTTLAGARRNDPRQW